MKYFLITLSILLITSCSKENSNIKSKTEILLTNYKWNRISMEVNPNILLPKQDDSGEFFTVTNIMDIEKLDGYDRNFEG